MIQRDIFRSVSINFSKAEHRAATVISIDLERHRTLGGGSHTLFLKKGTEIRYIEAKGQLNSLSCINCAKLMSAIKQKTLEGARMQVFTLGPTKTAS